MHVSGTVPLVAVAIFVALASVTEPGIRTGALAASRPARVGAQAAGAATRGYGTVAFRINVPRAAKSNATLDRRRIRPQYVSVSTQSFVVFTDGTNPVVADVNPATGFASVVVHAPVGIHTFTVTAYDALGGTGNVLSTGKTQPVYVPAAGTVGVNLTLDAVVASVVLTLAHPHATIGAGATIDLEVAAMDADGNTILGLENDSPTNTVFAQPFTLTSSDPVNGKISRTAIAKVVNEYPGAGEQISVTYSGANVSRITFSASGVGLKSVVPAVLVPLAPPATNEQIIVTPGELISSFSTPTGGQLLATFGVPRLPPPGDYGALKVDAAAGLLYAVHDFYSNALGLTQHIDVFQTSGAHALVDSFDPHIVVTDFAIDPVGKRLFATNPNSRDIWIFSTMVPHALLARIHSAFSGADVAVDPTSHRLFVGGCGPSCGGAGLNVFSTVPPYTALALVSSGLKPLAMAVGGASLYAVENPPQSAYPYVDVYATSSLVRVARIGPVGFPGGVAVDPTGRRLYVLCQTSDPSPYLDVSTVQVYELGGAFPLLGTFPSTQGGNAIVVAPYVP